MNIVDRIYRCQYCDKEFQSGRSLAGHVTGCKSNPKHDEICKKISNAKISRTIYIDKTIQCPVCKNYYKIHVSQRSYEKGNYYKTCSSECAHKLTKLNTDLQSKNSKIRETLRGKYIPHIKKSIYVCENCNREFEQYKRSSLKYLNKSDRPIYWSTRYCCKECMIQYRHRILSENAKNNKLGGYNSASGRGTKHHNGIYKGIRFDSSWELAFLIYHIDHNINISRCNEIRQYEYNDKSYKYYPDFCN